MSINVRLICFLCLTAFTQLIYAGAADHLSVPPLISTEGDSDKPNILVLLDNSGSMVWAANGAGVGMHHAESRSEISREVIRDLIGTYTDKIRMGLMAFKQTDLDKGYLHTLYYDVSYNSANYDPAYTGNDTSKKKYKAEADGRTFYYNEASAPTYSRKYSDPEFCYHKDGDISSTADLGAHACYYEKNNSTDGNTGLDEWVENWDLSTSSIPNVGKQVVFKYTANNFSGQRAPTGLLHVPVDDLNKTIDINTKVTIDGSEQKLYKDFGMTAAEAASATVTQADWLLKKLATPTIDSTGDTPIRNGGGTPIEGSMQTASSYFKYGILDSDDDVYGQTPSAPPANSCSGKDFVILLTDGLPSVDPSNGNVSDAGAALTKSAAIAADMLAKNGIRTYVVGFSLPSRVDPTLLDRVSKAGGTETAFIATDAASLKSSLNSIFLSIMNRTSSSTGAAVVANNSKGTGALYQAVYKPNIEDSLGNSVQWVGNLKGIFFDPKGNFREDTNQNDKLDSADKVATYFYDTVGGRTRVHLGSYDLNGEVVNSSTIEAEDLKAIWSARDNLAELTDFSNQRDYTEVASKGRHVLTTIDGSKLINFRALTSAQYLALVKAQTDAQSAYNSASSDDSSAKTNLEAKTKELDDAQTALDAAKLELKNATTDQATAQTDYNTALTNYSPDRLDMMNVWEKQQLSSIEVEKLNNAYAGTIDAYQAAEQDIATLEDEIVGYLEQLLLDKGVYSSLSVLKNAPELKDLYTTQVTAEDEQKKAAESYSDPVDGAAINLVNKIDGFQSSEDSFYSQVEHNKFDYIASSKVTYEQSLSLASSAEGSRNSAYTDVKTTWGDLHESNTKLTDALVVALGGTVPQHVVDKKSGADGLDALEAARVTALANASDAYKDFELGVESYSTDRTGSNTLYSGEFSTDLSTVKTESSDLTSANDRLADAKLDVPEKEGDLDDAKSDHEFAVAAKAETEKALNDALAVKNAKDAAVASADDDALVANHLGQSTAAEGLEVIRFIRGETVTGMRNRSVDYDNDGDVEKLLLGDIVHSSPAVVAAPQDRYDSIYNDETYAEYRNKYADRRQMIYVGGNDGMLHAFNGGFWDNSVNGFVKTMDGKVAHNLGDEIWSYVPKSVLPHLQWLTVPGYAHSYYVDGVPMAYDVNIFGEDDIHTNGWGTILVVGMRFGGGQIDVDTDYDGTKDYTSYSSVAIFDITDPESMPELLGEFSHAKMGYTTSTPALTKARIPGPTGYASPVKNEWILSWGSGPTVLDTANSTQSPSVFALDLNKMSYVSGWDPMTIPSTTLPSNTFLGDFNSVDFNGDFIDDAVYFGSSTDSVSTASGGKTLSSKGELVRIVLNNVDASGVPTNTWFSGAPIKKLMDSTTMGPFVSAPQVAKDNKGRNWVYAGAGRLFVNEDNGNSQKRQFYSIKEPVDSNLELTWGKASQNKLVNNSNVTVDKDGKLGASKTIGSTDVDTFSKLEKAMDDASNDIDGWVYDFEDDSNPSGRNLNKAVLLRKALYFTQYVPNTSQCKPEGKSYLHALYYKTGTWYHRFVDENGVDSDGKPKATNFTAKTEMGPGLISDPKIVGGEEGDTLMTQDSTSKLSSGGALEILVPMGRESWREIEL